jgi:hypothetical protein
MNIYIYQLLIKFIGTNNHPQFPPPCRRFKFKLLTPTGMRV